MCYAIFAIIIALLFLYSDVIIQEHALTMRFNETEWMAVANGWEMVQVIWPVMLLAAVVGSAMTYMLPRLFSALRAARKSRP